jgi:hypothetical protein
MFLLLNLSFQRKELFSTRAGIPKRENAVWGTFQNIIEEQFVKLYI